MGNDFNATKPTGMTSGTAMGVGSTPAPKPVVPEPMGSALPTADVSDSPVPVADSTVKPVEPPVEPVVSAEPPAPVMGGGAQVMPTEEDNTGGTPGAGPVGPV